MAVCVCVSMSMCQRICLNMCEYIYIYIKHIFLFLSSRLADIGLETFKLSELFSSILIPGFFLLACILQLHYFHKSFMKITDLEHVTPLHRYIISAQTNALQMSPDNYKSKLYLYNTIQTISCSCQLRQQVHENITGSIHTGQVKKN